MLGRARDGRGWVWGGVGPGVAGECSSGELGGVETALGCPGHVGSGPAVCKPSVVGDWCTIRVLGS